MTEDKVRVLRILEYVGPRKWIEETVARAIHGTRHLANGSITAVTLGEYPEVLERVRTQNEAEAKCDCAMGMKPPGRYAGSETGHALDCPVELASSAQEMGAR
jgi:hypothetical protein